MNDQPKKGLNETQPKNQQSTYKSGNDLKNDTSPMNETGQKGGKATGTIQDTADVERKDGEKLSEDADIEEGTVHQTDQ